MKSSQKEASGKEPVAKSMEQRAKRNCPMLYAFTFLLYMHLTFTCKNSQIKNKREGR
jgi:hypothetical protein